MTHLISILLTMIIVSTFCNGLHMISQKGMIFYFLRRWIDHKHEDNSAMLKDERIPFEEYEARERVLDVWNPIIMCVTCMASVWGTIIFIAMYIAGFYPEVAPYYVGTFFVMWATIVIGSSYLNTLLYRICERLMPT